MNFTSFAILIFFILPCCCIAQTVDTLKHAVFSSNNNFSANDFPSQSGKINSFRKTDNSLLKINGSILYSADYRSYIDTPFAQHNLIQHFTQTSINFLLKEKYPITVMLSGRQSNSSYFSNTLDVNVQFNRYQLLERMKADLRSRVDKMIDKRLFTDAEQLYQNKQKEVENLQQWLGSPAILQALVEEREKNIIQKLASPITKSDQIIQDSIANKATAIADTGLLKKYNDKREELSKQLAELKQYQSRLVQAKKAIQDSIIDIQRQINRLGNSSALHTFLKKQGIASNAFTRLQLFLLTLNRVGIGRTWIDYSSLTVKNISLTGVNIEANPGLFYIAMAAGKLNYRFRDFIIKNSSTLPGQSLFLARMGIGHKEKNNFIATFYTGKKSILNYPGTMPSASLQQIMGISVEAKLALNSNNYLITEIAKSSFNKHGNLPSSSSELLRKMVDFNMHKNEAYSVQLFSQNPQTNTRLTALYRKMGENFESFTLYPVNVNQDAWSVKLNQQFWKKRIVIDAGIRKNEFNSSIAAPSINSETIFKSVQASFRMPKYPFVVIGYYPTSQLSLSNADVLTENQYNTLNAVINYNYQFRRTGMNTGMVYTKFYNAGSDTGFIYYNASSLTVNQGIFFNRFSLQSSFATTQQRDIDFFSIEQTLSYQLNKRCALSGGLKWSRLNNVENLFGASAGLSVNVRHIGTFQFNYDKMYLPGYNKTLEPVDMGRMSICREF